MKVSVTLEDIRLGKKRNPCWCPIALAIRRASGLKSPIDAEPDEAISDDSRRCEVGGRTVALRGKVYSLPLEAMFFVAEFDRGNQVSPFEFELTKEVTR